MELLVDIIRCRRRALELGELATTSTILRADCAEVAVLATKVRTAPRELAAAC